MNVISASRRTDIPAFYTRWLMNRLRAGFCHWSNPYSGQVYRVSLAPQDTIALAFWTRNAAPLLPHLDELDARGYRYTFGCSLTGYARPLESHNPDPGAAVRMLHQLADHAGPEFVLWRYDPIIISSATPPDWHLAHFEALAGQLEGATRRCIYSFLDLYGKTRRNLAPISREHGIQFEALDTPQRHAFLRQLVDIARSHGMELYSCCEEDYLHVPGVRQNHCIDAALIARLTGTEWDLKAQPTREHCGCVASVDIGSYDTCLFGCSYCYATHSRALAVQRHADHHPDDTILLRPAALRGVDLDSIARPTRSTVPAQPRLL